ncbi:hypothetical protein M0D70_00735 [Acinetobacter portensis]|uniref:DUF4179 domain-containing protein n=1 Tax=Acinetobacter portensis TaxID=1839785 RepID=A0ABY4JVK6_9GAMM|nr:hypothetical protein [Acinetobacter portensis]MCK7607946.1 hypothetical protein [Acinetobacter portensis]MCK7638707.1 hypothetical protein [Acinetobacter portensis]UPO23470.1 hypothetical protein MZO21_01065 [Acinetobacter portensis]
MIKNLFKAFCLSIGLIAFSQVSFATTIKSTTDTKTTANVVSKMSPIEKALKQQKNDRKFNSEVDLKVLAQINSAPSQSFLASQNERFSRFIQSIFTQDNS